MDTIKHNLAQQLAEFKAAFAQRAAPERVATMEAATADLKASGAAGADTLAKAQAAVDAATAKLTELKGAGW